MPTLVSPLDLPSPDKTRKIRGALGDTAPPGGWPRLEDAAPFNRCVCPVGPFTLLFEPPPERPRGDAPEAELPSTFEPAWADPELLDDPLCPDAETSELLGDEPELGAPPCPALPLPC